VCLLGCVESAPSPETTENSKTALKADAQSIYDDPTAYRGIDPEGAQTAVDRLDYALKRKRSPLHGVPVLIKDNIETKDMPTTAGSFTLVNNNTGRDAPLVTSLREAGALIIGKANLSQWANFRSEDSTSGWSALGAQTRNPHATNRSPCGSSSGSGAAVAAGLVPAAIGTETNGSIICPSAMNGIVGFKPTVGVISQDLIVPISSTQDTAGPMTLTVKDAAIMMDAMTGNGSAYSEAVALMNIIHPRTLEKLRMMS